MTKRILRYHEFINERLHMFERDIENLENPSENPEGSEEETSGESQYSQEDLQSMIQEFKQLNDEVNKYREEFEQHIRPLVDKQEEIGDRIIELMDNLGVKSAEAENLVAKYQPSRQQKFPNYKKVYLAALDKVNEATKNVLEQLKEQYTTIGEYRKRLEIKDPGTQTKASKKYGTKFKSRIKENMISQGFNKLKQVFKNMYNALFGSYKKYEDAIEELKQAVNSAS
jgi:hypothetical protein